MAHTSIPTTPVGIQNQITAAFKQQFHDSFEIANQQTQSVLTPLVTSRGGIQGSSFTINDMGQLSMTPRGFTDRFTETKFAIPEAGTRLAYMEDFDLFVPIEPFDLPKLSAAPDSPYMQLMVAAANRAKDDLIYRQLWADIPRKTETPDQINANTHQPLAGAGAYTAQPLPDTQKIHDKAPGAFTKEALISIRALFRKNYADNETIYMLYNSQMMIDILNDHTLTSADFMAVQMLQQGNVSSNWMGFQWVPYERLATVGATGNLTTTIADIKGYKTCAFTKTALHFGTGINYSTDIQTRADLRNIKQLSAQMSFGAGRANEKKVVTINFANSSRQITA